MCEYYDPERCRICGGRCCQIYLPLSEGGMFPAEKVVLPKWHAYLHENKEEYGVEPLFNPLKVHALGNEHLLRELRERGIDPNSCEYIGENGCRIPWPKRPKRCRTFRCLEWAEEEMG